MRQLWLIIAVLQMVMDFPTADSAEEMAEGPKYTERFKKLSPEQQEALAGMIQSSPDGADALESLSPELGEILEMLENGEPDEAGEAPGPGVTSVPAEPANMKTARYA